MSDEQQPRTRRSCAKSAGRIPPSTIVGGGGDGDGGEGGGWGGGRCNSSDRLSTIDGNNNSEMYQNPRSGRGLSSPAPSGTSSTNTGEDDAELPKMRRSCDYCVRMKRACDGKTPCELCTRRNKNCTRSVKKKSGPAKGTKYAARRARPHEETQQPRGKQIDLSSSSSGNRGGGGGGGGVVSPNVGRISGSGSGGGGSTVAGVLTHNTPGGLSSLALNSQQRRPTPSSAGGRSRELPPSSSAATCRGGLASPSRGSSAVITPLGYPQVVGPGAGGAGVENSGMGGELGIAIPQQHHSGGGVGGANIESQQLISTFPGVLQDPSIWGGPSPEELGIVGNMESNPLCPPITQGDPQYTDAVTRRVTQAWEEGSVGGGVGGGGRLDFPDGGGIAYSRGIRRDNRSTGTGAGPAADWPPRLSRQPRRGNAGAGTGGADGGAGGEGGDDQPHFFPQAFRRAQPQLQQQQRQHNRRPSLTSLPMSPYSVHDVFSGGGAGAGGVGGSHHPIMPFGRSAGEGGGRDSIGGYENSMRLGYVGPETAQRVSVSRGGSAGAGGEVRSGGFEFEPADPGGGGGTDGVGFEGADGGRMVQGVDGGGLLSAVRVDGLSPSDPGAFMGSGIGGAGNQQHSQHIQWHAHPHNRLQQSQELWQRFSHARLSPLQQEQNPPLRGPQGGGDAVPEANADDLASPAGSQSLRTAATGGGSGGSGSGARSISQELYPVADNGQQSLPWG